MAERHRGEMKRLLLLAALSAALAGLGVSAAAGPASRAAEASLLHGI
jgi:hypothetical protein